MSRFLSLTALKAGRQPVAMNSLTSDPRETGRSSGPWYARESTPPAAGHTRNRRSRKLITIVTAGAAAALAAIASVVIIAVAPAGKGSTAGFVPTGSSPDEDGEQITAAFLSAWKAGDLRQSARHERPRPAPRLHPAEPAPGPGQQLVHYAQPPAGAYAGASGRQKIFTGRHKPG